jgi:RNA polymerase sigma factor (sigma-70 family)
MDRNPNETVRKMAEEALSRLAAELEAGRSEALTNHLAAMSRFRRYSWSNVLLIEAQRPDATQVAGFHTWTDLGRAVKKGEKGIMIFAPGVVKQHGPLRGQAPPNDAFPLAGFRAAYVFDVSQTEGKPVPELTHANADIWEYGEQIRVLVAKRGIDLQVDRSIEPARGVSTGGKIRLMPGLSPIQYLSVLTHELAHEMLHHRPEAAALLRDAIEAQAEGVAYVVARGLGVETHTATAEYMAPYSSDKKAVAQTLAAIQETSAQILDELLPEGRTLAGRVVASVQKRSPLDAEAFGKIHDQYRGRLVQSVAGFVRDPDKAQDIASRAFQAAWEKRESFRGEATPYTWLQAIARNEARQSVHRERMVQVDSIDIDDRDFAAPELVTDELEKRDDRFRLQMALERVPIMYRRALTAHFIEGLSIREIALRERVPLGTVLSRIFTGKQLLRHAWEAPLTGPHADAPARGTPSPKPEERQRSQAPGPSEHQLPESPDPVTWDR